MLAASEVVECLELLESAYAGRLEAEHAYQPDNAIAYVMAENDKGVTHVVLPGTDVMSLADWATNLRFKVNAQGFHRGFAQYADILWHAFADIVASRRKIVWVGHSLGGAAAQLLGFKRATAAAADEVEQKVITFGSPKVAREDVAVASYGVHLGRQTYNYIIFNDPVWKMPRAWQGYRLVGNVMIPSESGTQWENFVTEPVVIPEKHKRDSQRAELMVAEFRSILRGENLVRFHKMDTYLQVARAIAAHPFLA